MSIVIIILLSFLVYSSACVNANGTSTDCFAAFLVPVYSAIRTEIVFQSSLFSFVKRKTIPSPGG
jgi:hypothetical protein